METDQLLQIGQEEYDPTKDYSFLLVELLEKLLAEKTQELASIKNKEGKKE